MILLEDLTTGKLYDCGAYLYGPEECDDILFTNKIWNPFDIFFWTQHILQWFQTNSNDAKLKKRLFRLIHNSGRREFVRIASVHCSSGLHYYEFKEVTNNFELIQRHKEILGGSKCHQE